MYPPLQTPPAKRARTKGPPPSPRLSDEWVFVSGDIPRPTRVLGPAALLHHKGHALSAHCAGTPLTLKEKVLLGTANPREVESAEAAEMAALLGDDVVLAASAAPNPITTTAGLGKFEFGFPPVAKLEKMKGHNWCDDWDEDEHTGDTTETEDDDDEAPETPPRLFETPPRLEKPPKDLLGDLGDLGDFPPPSPLRSLLQIDFDADGNHAAMCACDICESIPNRRCENCKTNLSYCLEHPWETSGATFCYAADYKAEWIEKTFTKEVLECTRHTPFCSCFD